MADLKNSLRWFAAASGAVVPASTYFTSNVPPLFPEICIITSALSLAIIYTVSTYRPKQKWSATGTMPTLVRWANIFLAFAIFLLVVQVLLLRFTTVPDPQLGQKFQVGFGTATWSLTSRGYNCIYSEHRSEQDCMLASAGAEQRRSGKHGRLS